ncbi:MAG: CapA family protein [Tissierellia bacterium]|nr:CapA family protein [Tissierellia bacterium]
MEKKFIITFAGDTSLGDWYIQKSGSKDLLQRLESNPESFFEGIKPIINDSDYVILNLETVLADNPSIYFPDKKYPNFDKSERLIKLLKSIGVTAVSLANNHTMDFGPSVMLETKELLEKNKIQTFGSGKTLEEAEQPFKITLAGKKSKKNIYIIGGMNTSILYQEKYSFFATEDNPGINSLNLQRLHQLINKIHNEDPNSFIIMFLHWQGIDYQFASENEKIRDICTELIEYGVNYIIGHGPHILNDFDNNKSGNVAYSIGNFVFNSKGRYKKLEAPPYSAIAKLQFEENEYDWSIESRFYPIVTDNLITNYQSSAINELEYRNLIEMLSKKNAINLIKDSIGYYFSTNIDNPELPLSFQNKKIDDFNISDIISQKPNEYKYQPFNVHNLLITEFEKRGYLPTRFEGYLIVNIGKENVILLETESSYDSSVAVRIAKDKIIMRKFLKKAGLSIVDGKSFSIHEKEKALNYALSLPSSVIKPANGNKGRGVSVGVKNKKEFINAWDNAVSVTSNKILVEEQFIGGTEARYTVVDGCCVAVYIGIPPTIVGNGIDTIETLIKQKNEYKLNNNPNLEKLTIKIDEHRLSILNNQGYNLSSIPDKGVHIQLDWKGGLGTGAENIEVTDKVHPLFKKIAEKAVNSIPGLFISGVDILAHNHFKEPNDKNYTIVEVNSRPGIGGHHFPVYGKPRNVSSIIVEQCIKRVLKERNETNDN